MPFHYIGLKAIENRAKAALLVGVKESAEDLKDKAQSKTPTLTGALEGGEEVEGPHLLGDRVEAKVKTSGSADEYAVYEHEGHYAHDDGQRKFIQEPLLAHGPAHKAAIAKAAKRLL